MTAGFQNASLSVHQRGQMSGFAVEEQAQPHLINNIIVLLHATIKTPPPILPFFFSFFLFQAPAACCPVARLSQSDTATIHKNKTWVKSQRDETTSATVSCWSKARKHRRESSASIFKDFASFVLLFFCNYEVRVTWAANKSSACLQQVKHRRGKFTYISASKKISEYKPRVSRESLCVHMCVYSKPADQPDCLLLLCKFWLVFSFFRFSVAKAVTPHVSKLLIEDKQ